MLLHKQHFEIHAMYFTNVSIGFIILDYATNHCIMYFEVAIAIMSGHCYFKIHYNETTIHLNTNAQILTSKYKH